MRFLPPAAPGPSEGRVVHNSGRQRRGWCEREFNKTRALSPPPTVEFLVNSLEWPEFMKASGYAITGTISAYLRSASAAFASPASGSCSPTELKQQQKPPRWMQFRKNVASV